MKTSRPSSWLVFAGSIRLVAVLLALQGTALCALRGAEAPTTEPVAVAPNQTAKPASNAAPAGALSPLVAEVLKMAAADVSPAVLRTYVECSPMVYEMSHADVIALKQAHVADEVVTLLLQRGAEIRSARLQARREAAARASAPAKSVVGLDPESYEYFQYYHLHSRTLATVAQNYSPYWYPGIVSGVAYGGPFGYWRPYGLRPSSLR